MSDFIDRENDPKLTRIYKQETPDLLAKFMEFDEAVFAPEGREIPLKYRELMAFAVGVTTQCTYCIAAHAKAAADAGASDAEIAESAWVATAIRAGGGYTHGRLGFKFDGHGHGH